MSDLRQLLKRTAEMAADFYESLDTRPVFPQVTIEDLRAALGGPAGFVPARRAAGIDPLLAVRHE